MMHIRSVDSTSEALTAQQLEYLVDGLQSQELVQIDLLTAVAAKELLEELLALQGTYFDPWQSSYSQILLAPELNIALFNWGTGGEDQADPIDLARYPRLTYVLDIAVQMGARLRAPHEKTLFSIVPSLLRTRSFPRFYHRDSHFSLNELTDERAHPSSYRMVWDVGLENSYQVLNVNFIPRNSVVDDSGTIREGYQQLFQQQYINDFRNLTEADINAIQQQMTEELLPFPETQADLLPGRAVIWLDDYFFHSVYLRKGKDVSELQDNRRSILIVREFCNNLYRDIPWSPAVKQYLTDLLQE